MPWTEARKESGAGKQVCKLQRATWLTFLTCGHHLAFNHVQAQVHCSMWQGPTVFIVSSPECIAAIASRCQEISPKHISSVYDMEWMYPILPCFKERHQLSIGRFPLHAVQQSKHIIQQSIV